MNMQSANATSTLSMLKPEIAGNLDAPKPAWLSGLSTLSTLSTYFKASKKRDSKPSGTAGAAVAVPFSVASQKEPDNVDNVDEASVYQGFGRPRWFAELGQTDQRGRISKIYQLIDLAEQTRSLTMPQALDLLHQLRAVTVQRRYFRCNLK